MQHYTWMKKCFLYTSTDETHVRQGRENRRENKRENRKENIEERIEENIEERIEVRIGERIEGGYSTEETLSVQEKNNIWE